MRDKIKYIITQVCLFFLLTLMTACFIYAVIYQGLYDTSGKLWLWIVMGLGIAGVVLVASLSINVSEQRKKRMKIHIKRKVPASTANTDENT